MARELPIIRPGDVISYSISDCHYVSVVVSIQGFDRNGYVELEIYDLQTPSNVSFPPATRDATIEISLNLLIAELTVHDYDTYVQQYPELFI